MRWSGTLALVLAGLCGCAGDEPAWAFQHGTFDLGDEGIEGYQVWELFSERWKKSKNERFHVCARVQTLSGEPASALSGCISCTSTYALHTEELETDCKGGPATLEGFAGVTHFAFGPLTGGSGEGAPYPEHALGWYASWDGRTLEPLGYAWNARLDDGEPPGDEGLVVGERYVFWPAYAWDLEPD